ncbi:hypothetical protein ACNPFM_003738 [Vibrio parahaemolyticus]
MSKLALALLLAFSAIVGTILFWVGLFFWFDQPVSVLVEKGVVIGGNDLLSQISGFYTTIITLLITLLTILGISIPLYIKTNAETVASRQTKNEVVRYCSENIGFQNALENALEREKPHIMDSLGEGYEALDEDISMLQEQIRDLDPHIDKIQEFNPEDINQIKRDLQAIQKYIQRLDPFVDDTDEELIEDF